MDFIFNMGLDTKVDAINAVLRAIGTVGINSEDEVEWNIDAAEADKLLDVMSQNIQANRGNGWWFNREEFHKLQADPVNGYVTAPGNALSVLVHRVNGKPIPVTFRDGKLFDAKNNGYDMRGMMMSDGKLHCTIVVCLAFEALPSTAKQAVVDAARFWVVTEKEGDQIKMGAMQQEAQRSFVSLQSEDARQKRSNMFNNSRIQHHVYGAGGYNNN